MLQWLLLCSWFSLSNWIFLISLHQWESLFDQWFVLTSSFSLTCCWDFDSIWRFTHSNQWFVIRDLLNIILAIESIHFWQWASLNGWFLVTWCSVAIDLFWFKTLLIWLRAIHFQGPLICSQFRVKAYQIQLRGLVEACVECSIKMFETWVVVELRIRMLSFWLCIH